MGRALLRIGGSALLTWLAWVLAHRLAVAMDFGPPVVVNVIALCMMAPLCGWAITPYLFEMIPAIRDRARSDVCEPMNGRHYAFDNHRVRLFLLDGVIWLPEQDLSAIVRPWPEGRELRALGDDYGVIPDKKLRGFTERGLLRLMTTRTSGRFATHDMIRFKRWLEHEALPNLRRFHVSAAE